MLRWASLERRPEKYKDWLTDEDTDLLRGLSTSTDTEAGARFCESWVGTSRTDTLQDLPFDLFPWASPSAAPAKTDTPPQPSGRPGWAVPREICERYVELGRTPPLAI